VTTDFIIVSILLIMEIDGKSPSELSLFLSSSLGYKSLQIYFLSIRDRIEATKHVQNSDLEFDKDFDRISSIKRLEQKDALQGWVDGEISIRRQSAHNGD
jgi:hypothetical protein